MRVVDDFFMTSYLHKSMFQRPCFSFKAALKEPSVYPIVLLATSRNMVSKAKASSKKRTRGPVKSKNGASSSNGDIIAERTRQTKTHIFFWAGPLSNWYKGDPYSGARALSLTIDRLDKLDIDHPPASALSSRLLAAHKFNCGEQWLMAMKGWLFERDIKLSEMAVTDVEFASISAQILAPQPPPKDQPHIRELYLSTLCSVLRTASPKQQKILGRKCRNLDPAIWDIASVPVVVACSIARAESNYVLKKIYLKAGKRTFVEGSPTDTIWGVGIHWGHPSIEDPINWRGTNRLGVCHGIVRDVVLENFGDEFVAI
jgi:ribA/ribD-fused uncharacterized protein